MTNQQNKERWIFVAAFGLLSVLFNALPLFDGMNRFFVSWMVGGTGGIIGALLYGLVANKSNGLKYGSLAIGACIVFGLFYFMVSYYKKKEEAQKKSPFDLFINSWSSHMEEALKQPIDTSTFYASALTKEERSRLITCEICGYKGLNPDSAHCYNCLREVFDTSIYEPSKKMEWLKDQQIMWFLPDEKSGKVDFYGPKERRGFKKDPSWRPKATEAEVIEFNVD